MSRELKQRYLLANSPKPPSFEEERNNQFEKLIVLISTTQRSKWLSTGFSCGPLIESYKQVYGLTSQQFQTLLMLLINIAFQEVGLSTDVKAYILRLLNTMSQFQIKITDNFKISNRKLLKFLEELAKEGMDGALKHSDAVIEDLSKFILYFSRFGEEVIEEALEMAVESNDIRYLVIFIRSIKTEAAALRLLTQLFSDNNLWDRDCSWFYILGEIIKKFPKMDYSAYYQTIMQEVIRAFTTIINGDNEQSLKKLTVSDSYLQIQPVLKSAALIITFLILPAKNPQHVFIKSCIQRLFSLISSSLDYVNPPDYLGDLMTFAKAFVRYFLMRYRGERGLYKLFNEDVIDDIHEVKENHFLIDSEAQSFFDSLWVEIIPKMIFLEDPQECKPSKIIAQLCMYKPQTFMELALNAVMNVVDREDPTLVSFHGAKITILFLQEFVMLDQPKYLSTFFESTLKMMGHLDRLGITQNLDIVELFCRNFIYLTQDQLNQYYVQSAINDTLIMLLDNLESMSIALQDSEEEQAELYIDFSNIYFPFFLRLDETQISTFSQKFIYKIVNNVPEHRGAYEMIVIVLTYIDSSFPSKLFHHIRGKLLYTQTEKQPKEGDEEEEDTWEFLKQTKQSLHTSNQQVLKWYSSIIQCLFQYHPKNIVKHWSQIQPLIVVLLHEWDNQSYLEIALDILYNLILCLCKPHLDWKQFRKPQNANYRTLNLKFDTITPETKEVIDYIFKTYFVDIRLYLEEFYSKEIEGSSSDLTVLGDFQNYHEVPQDSDIIRIRKRNLKLADFVLMPELDKEEEAYDKRIIYRALSIQYTVLSALMFRVPFHSDLENIGDFLTDPQYSNLRSDTCKYLQWVLQLLGRFSLMGDEQCIKLFNYFWRESHDQVCFTAPLQATNQKLSPYYYPQLHKKKEILRSPFLVVNEAYVSHMARMEFHLMVAPTAYINNKQYLESNFILGLSPIYQPSLHSYFPNYVQVHQYHRELIAIGRYHLNPKNEESYLTKYLKEQDLATKQRYATAIRCLILSFKKLLNVFSDSCCMRDEFVRNTIFDTVSLYKLLPKKTEKSLVYELLYVLLVFSFDPNCCQEYKEYSLKQFWQYKLNNNPLIKDLEIASTSESGNIESILKRIQEEEDQALAYIDLNRTLKLTRSCSFQNDSEMQKQLERAVTFLLTKIEQNLESLEKDFNVYLLMLLLYSNCLHLSDPLISKIIVLLSKLCQSTYNDIFQMSKTGFFHIVNRFNYHLRTTISMDNTPVRRTWEDFLKYKYIGANNSDYQSLKIQKNEQNFYPTKKLTIYKYRKLGQDPTAPTYTNQQTLLSIFEDEDKMYNFLKNCSLDPDLKQSDQSTFSLIVSEENFKSVSSGAHKLMHFIWDSNPTKTPLFMGVLQRYAASPLNFYNRLFRKILRMGSDKLRTSCINLAKKLRDSQQPEMIRLSFYISCELLIKNPESEEHKTFLDYLGECTKENFDYVLMGFYGIFTSNLVNAERCYNVVLEKLRGLKGAPRLRHLELSNTYMIAQGRFARKAAIEISGLIMKGIQEGGDQISEAVVSMITECFVQAVNLKNLKDWVEQPLETLLKNEKVYLLNEYVGYNRQNFLMVLLAELTKKAKEEDVSVESQKLRINSQVVRKILASITIFRFNEYFYNLLKQIIIYVMERPQSAVDDDSADFYVITQLCDSQYPEDIYKDLLEQLLPMTDRTPYVIKKKLMFLQGMVINRSFRLNRIDIPPLLSLNQKQLTLDHIITVATILRLMKSIQLTELVEEVLKGEKRQKHDTYILIAVLMATGSREFDWKETILRDLVKHKKDKLVKEGISEWWKGKSPESQHDHRMQTLVRNFENPYSYFA